MMKLPITLIVLSFVSSCQEDGLAKLEKEIYDNHLKFYKDKEYSAKIFSTCYSGKFKSYNDYKQSPSDQRAMASVECKRIIRPSNKQEAFDNFGYGYMEFISHYSKTEPMNVDSVSLATGAKKLFTHFLGQSWQSETKQSLYFAGCAIASTQIASNGGNVELAQNNHPAKSKAWCGYDNAR